MDIPEFSYATLAAARASTAPEIGLSLNLPKSEKLLNEIFAFPNLVSLTLDISAGFGDIPQSLLQAPKLRKIRFEQADKHPTPLTLPDIFLEMPQLEDLSFAYCNNLTLGDKDWSGLKSLQHFYAYGLGTTFPIGIIKAPCLQRMDISNIRCEYIPKEISQIKTLKRLFLRHKNIPSTITELPYLEYLLLDTTSIPDWIDQLNPDIRHLIIYTHEKTDLLNEGIFEYKNLETLTIRSGIKELSPKIGQLKRLKYLAIWRNGLSDLPDTLADLADLETLDICNNAFLKMPGVIAKLPKLVKFEHEHNLVHNSIVNRFNDLLTWFKINPSASPEMRSFLADRWDNRPIKPEEIKPEFIDKALSMGIAPIPTNTIACLAYQSPQAFRPFKAGDVLVIHGKTTTPNKVLKQKLTPLGITITSEFPLFKPEEKITHFLIDEKVRLSAIHWLGFPAISLLTNTQLVDFLNNVAPDYLVENAQAAGDTDMVGRVNDLLFSMDANNIAVGLGLLKGGGVPENCKTALFAVCKLSDEAQHRSTASKLLQSIASETLRDALKKRIVLHNIKRGASAIGVEQLLSAFDHTEIDMFAFVSLWNKIQPDINILHYLVKRGASAHIKTYLLNQIKAGKLSLDPSRNGLISLPLELFELGDQVKHIHIYHYDHRWTEEGMFPEQFTQLQGLETLEIYYAGKYISALPTVLTKLTWLKRLKINTTEEIKTQLRNYLKDCVVE